MAKKVEGTELEVLTANLDLFDGESPQERTLHAEKILQEQFPIKSEDPDVPFFRLPTRIQTLLAKTRENPSDIKIKKSVLRRLVTQMRSIRSSATASSAMICKGESECPNAQDCIFVMAEIEEPVGMPCPVEEDLIETWINSYRHAVYENRRGVPVPVEFDQIDEGMIMEIVFCDLIIRRSNGYLQKEGLLAITPSFGTSEGDVIYENVVHPMVETIFKAKRERERLFQQMLLTPEMQAKYKQKSGTRADDKAKLSRMIDKYMTSENIKTDPKGNPLEGISRTISVTSIEDDDIIKAKEL